MRTASWSASSKKWTPRTPQGRFWTKRDTHLIRLSREHLPARRCLQQHGVPFDPDKRARQMTRSDYERFDRIVYMETYNLRGIRRIIPEDPEGKIHLMMSYTGSGRDIADPWYTGDFERTFQDLLKACEAMLKEYLDYKKRTGRFI